MIEIGGLQRSTLIDYPGHIACTVFLVGCNFRCPWCHSPEIVLPEISIQQPRVSKREFFEFLDLRKGLLQGVVVCGGEPTINKDLPEFISEIKRRGFKVKLDTNGSNPTAIKELFANQLLDYVAMDVKAPLKESDYSTAIGVRADPKRIMESVELIKSSGVDYEFRTTVVPGLHGKEEIKEIAKAISPAKKYFLQAFRSIKNIDASLVGSPTPSDDFMKDLREEVRGMFDICEIR